MMQLATGAQTPKSLDAWRLSGAPLPPRASAVVKMLLSAYAL